MILSIIGTGILRDQVYTFKIQPHAQDTIIDFVLLKLKLTNLFQMHILVCPDMLSPIV